MGLDTGNGTTVAFTSGTFAASIISVDPGSESIESLDASHLGTTGDMEKEPGDLRDHDAWSFTYFADPTDSDKFTPPVGTKDTLTITYPSQLAGADATYAGTGFVTSATPPSLANNGLMQGTFEFQFDGKTGPTFTEEAAS